MLGGYCDQIMAIIDLMTQSKLTQYIKEFNQLRTEESNTINHSDKYKD
jgi:hypothetical protein